MYTKHKACLYRALSKVPCDDLASVFKRMDKSGLDAICEFIFNTIYNDLKLSKSKRNKIKTIFKEKRSRRNLNIITDKNKDIEKKRKALIQEGRGIGLILATVAPLLASLFSRKSN